MKDRELPEPPIIRLAGIEAIRIDPGDTLYRCIADQSFLNPIGLIHGGLICTLLDYATATLRMSWRTSFQPFSLRLRQQEAVEAR